MVGQVGNGDWVDLHLVRHGVAWSLWHGRSGMVALAWSLWHGRSGMVALAWSLWHGRSGMVALAWSLWHGRSGMVALAWSLWHGRSGMVGLPHGHICVPFAGSCIHNTVATCEPFNNGKCETFNVEQEVGDSKVSFLVVISSILFLFFISMCAWYEEICIFILNSRIHFHSNFRTK